MLPTTMMMWMTTTTTICDFRLSDHFTQLPPLRPDTQKYRQLTNCYPVFV